MRDDAEARGIDGRLLCLRDHPAYQEIDSELFKQAGTFERVLVRQIPLLPALFPVLRDIDKQNSTSLIENGRDTPLPEWNRDSHAGLENAMNVPVRAHGQVQMWIKAIPLLVVPIPPVVILKMRHFAADAKPGILHFAIAGQGVCRLHSLLAWLTALVWVLPPINKFDIGNLCANVICFVVT